MDETNTIDVNGTRFVDVSPDNYFVDPVIWAIQKGITNGTGTYSFSPNDNCTTAQVITFIWRAYGSPEPSISCPFANLTGSEYYYKATLWTYENYRQAEGLPMESGKNFNPETECSRSMAVLYMWAAAGGPAPTETMEFSDVLPSRPDAPAMSWAVQQGITNGTGENTFSPGKICTRAEIVTFLYRGRTMTPEEIAAAEARIEAEMDAFIAELRLVKIPLTLLVVRSVSIVMCGVSDGYELAKRARSFAPRPFLLKMAAWVTPRRGFF